MKKQSAYSLLLIGLLLVSFNSCLSNPDTPLVAPTSTPTIKFVANISMPLSSGKNSGDQFCIPPVASIAYPVDLPPKLPLKAEAAIPPSGGWQSVADLPVAGQPIGKIVARTNNEIWIAYLPQSGGLWQYRLDSNQWKGYSSIGGTNVFIYDIFLTPKDDLWGLGYVMPKGTYIASRFFLSKYDRSSDQFQFSPIGAEIFDTYNVDVIKQDSRGVIWLMAQKKDQQFPGSLFGGRPFMLFSIDLSAQRVKQYQEFPWPGNFEISNDGSLWMIVDDNGPVLHLQQFIPTTNEIRNYWNFPPAISGVKKASDVTLLYFDRLGHLWLDDRGWVDFSDPQQPVWYQMIRSPAFLIDRGEVDSRYVWIRPSEMYQSTDGMYWFGSFYGLVSLNPKSGEWCKFTNGTSPFAEDNNHNLWIGVFGRLYKYTIAP